MAATAAGRRDRLGFGTRTTAAAAAMTRDRVTPDDAVEAAIARVLDAEHEARDAVRDAGDAAAAQVEHARAVARAIAERAERRIGAVRARFERKTAAEVAALDAEAADAGTPHELGPDDHARLDAAIAELAARLTGGTMR
jgi:hypothetical protein